MRGGRIRVAFVAHAFDVGGAEEMVLSLVRHLPPRFEPVVCAFHRTGAIGEEIAAAGVRVDALGLDPGLRRPRDVWRLRNHLRRTAPVIVHTFLLAGSLFGRAAAILAGIPIVIGTEVNLYRRKRPHHALAERLLMRGTDAVVASAESVRDFYIGQVRADPAKVEVIYNAVDWSQLQTTEAPEAVRASLGVPVGAPVAGIIARLTEQKAHRVLFEALASHDRLAGVHLMVVGDGELRGELEDRAAALGLSTRVHFLGARRDLGNLLAAVDVFVMPSFWEGLPLAMILAMGAGLPVVATRVAGIPEVVQDGRTGWLVPPGDSAALAAALVQVVDDPDAGRRMGRAARAFVTPRFGADQYVDAVSRLYDRLLSARNLV